MKIVHICAKVILVISFFSDEPWFSYMKHTISLHKIPESRSSYICITLLTNVSFWPHLSLFPSKACTTAGCLQSEPVNFSTLSALAEGQDAPTITPVSATELFVKWNPPRFPNGQSYWNENNAHWFCVFSYIFVSSVYIMFVIVYIICV